jgi:hypothetical protein
MSIQRYKRKQIVAEAIQFNGANFAEIAAWCPLVQDLGGGQIKLNLPGGANVTLVKDDWVIKAGNSFGPGRLQDYGYVPFGDVWESL